MKLSDIIIQLNQNHSSFIDLIYSLDDAQFEHSVQNKWSAGQQLEHIYLSIKPLEKALLLPRFLLRLFFGKTRQPSHRYDMVVEKYKDQLAHGAKASPKYIPELVSNDKREALIKSLRHSLYQLTSLIKKFKEEDMDSFLLPHPLLGKLTLREMLYFTIYHVKHHEANIREMLGIHTI
jgi:hypothetical protein